MSDIKTLQERLNALADAKLNDHVNKAFCEVDKLRMHSARTQLTHNTDPYPGQFCDVIRHLKAVAVKALKEAWRETETSDFIAKVGRLQDEIDELRNKVCEAT